MIFGREEKYNTGNDIKKCFIPVTIDTMSLKQTDHWWHMLSFSRNNQYEAWMIEIKY